MNPNLVNPPLSQPINTKLDYQALHAHARNQNLPAFARELERILTHISAQSTAGVREV